MKIRSVKLNFVLNTLRLCLGAGFILLTTPYVTRVLGVENLGKVDYVNSIIMYFILFTGLGIPKYGIREVARVRENESDRTRVVLELGILLLVTSLLAYVILYFLLSYSFKFHENKNLIIIMSTGIIFSNMGFEWFYQGIEDQVYITIRFIIVRVLVLILIFLLLKSPDDYIVYGGLTVLMTSGSNILNILNLRKYLKFRDIKIKQINIRRHIKSISVIFLASLSVSIYLQLDVVMLGMFTEDKVALYTVPNRLIRLVLIFVTALGVVLLPRITNALENNKIEEYKKYLDISIKYILISSLPIVTGILLLSNEIILVMAGEEFIEAAKTMRLLAIIVFIVGVAYFLGYQLLYPLGLEKYYTIAVTIAAICNFIFNYIMIPKFYQNGAAMGTILAESTGVLIMLYYGKNKLKEIEFYNKSNLKYFLASLIMGIAIFIIKSLQIGSIKTILLSLVLGGLVYLIVLIILKEKVILYIIKMIELKIQKNIKD